MTRTLEVCPQLVSPAAVEAPEAAERRRGGAWPRIRTEFDLHLSAARFAAALTSTTPAADVEAATHALRAGIRMTSRLFA